MSTGIQVRSWPDAEQPTEDQLQRRLNEHNLQPYRWSNGPHFEYNAHTHSYHKVIYVVHGSITFGFPDGEHEPVTLHAGDRLDLPPNIAHDAVVGPDGVACLEAHR